MKKYLKHRNKYMFQLIKNIIGFISGYGNCDCGNTFWNNSSNPGIDYGNGSGRVICNDCYLKNKKEIDENNRKVGGGVDIKDKNCKHKWERQSCANFWCPKCGSIMSLACSHGGSIACDDCVNEWIKENIKI